MRVLSKIMAFALAMTIVFSATDTKVFAERSLQSTHLTTVAETSNTEVTPRAGGTYQIYTDSYRRIYTGQGSAKWIHINPYVEPAHFTIKMVNYSGATVWEESFSSTNGTHWYVGADVHYVYLKGGPGTVSVSVTNN